MRSSTPTAFKMGFSKGEKLSRRRGWVYFILCERVLHSMCAENIPSKDVYVFFILRRRVQRYCTAVRGVKNKKYIHRRHNILRVQIKYACPRRCTKFRHLFPAHLVAYTVTGTEYPLSSRNSAMPLPSAYSQLSRFAFIVTVMSPFLLVVPSVGVRISSQP